MNAKWKKIIAGLALWLLFLGTVAIYFFYFESDWYRLSTDILYEVSALIAVIAGFLLVRAYKKNAHSVPIAYITLGLASWAIGELVFIIFEQRGIETYPSIADFFYLIAYPLVLIGFYKELQISVKDKFTLRKTETIFWLLFALLIAVKLIFFRDIDPENSAIANIFNIFYGVVDMVLLSAIFINLYILFFKIKENKQIYRGWLSVLLGFALYLSADFIYYANIQLYDERYFYVRLLDLLWIAGYLLAAYGFFQIYLYVKSNLELQKGRAQKLTFKIVYNSFVKYLYENFNFYEPDIKIRREKFLKSFSIIAMLFYSILGLVELVFLKYSTGIALITLGLFFIVNVFALRYTKNMKLAMSIALVLVFGTVILLLSTGGIYNTGIFWIFVFPPAAFFLMGKKKGILWMFYLIVVLIMMMVLRYFNIIFLSYTFQTILMSVVALSLLTIMTYVYEAVSEYASEELQERNKNLSEINVNLQNEIRARLKVEKKLNDELGQSEKLNQLTVGRELKIAEYKKLLKEKN